MEIKFFEGCGCAAISSLPDELHARGLIFLRYAHDLERTLGEDRR
jgi:hypothetical protein